MSEKLQKILANAGLGSRREMEKWIEQGRVSVDGNVAKLGERAEPGQTIRVDGKPLNTQNKESVCRVLMYNKPEGEICSRNDQEGRPTVFDRLPNINAGRWIAVGRLDLNTSGLLLFTNDGELANRLMHPRHQVEREYAVRVFGQVEQAMLNRLRNGVELEDGKARFTTVTHRTGDGDGLNQWFNVTLEEGRNREVRRLWESQGLQVSRLIRVKYGPLALNPRLPQGAWLELPLDDVNALRQSVGLNAETETFVTETDEKLDHVRLMRMRRSVKKHKSQANNRRRRLIK
ncbi:23S rRNA pseudouridine(2605) synthase RluB [Aestuariibacter salexigens]|uniref:23S rRNA pseudouridine(2605) synthase RluB n=1 Tax=Aestuariibacter salexigens TaxID=226010 RepID=UPI0004083966|nr:23S rRNA pseudouridine(2605) synthase RluB [Aestuariibacter salexigens]